jgi:hypothetical protein
MDHEYPRDTDNGGCLKPVHLDWSRVKLAHQQHLTKLILKDLCWLTEQQVPCLLAAVRFFATLHLNTKYFIKLEMPSH